MSLSPDHRPEAVRELLLQLERGCSGLEAPSEAKSVFANVKDRISRDLLPRLEASPEFAVVGIVGPNNSGKSTLFSALASASKPGPALSPSSPTGGFTRVLVGAANPDAEVDVQKGLARRFDVTYLGASRPDAKQVHESADSHQLLLVDAPSLPDWLVLIDTPDFDSVFTENRAAGDALLLTADLLVIVVTPQTYQNLGVVDFLRHAIRGGRPYVLLYNEGSSAEVARRHTEKLASDLGRAPIARFFAPHDVGVQEVGATLVPVSLDESEPGTLANWLFDRRWTDAVMREAWLASSRALVGDLRLLAELWTDSAQAPLSLHRAMQERLNGFAKEVTRTLFPVAPFREALQAQLDQRSNLHRALRYVPETLGGVVRSGYDSIRRVFLNPEELLTSAERFRSAERDQLIGDEEGSARRRELFRLWEALASDVHAHRGGVAEACASADFGTPARASLTTRLSDLHDAAPLPFLDFQAECERSIDAELRSRGEEAGLQWAYTGLKLLPPVTAVAVMALTGVVGDVSAGVAYLATEPFLHKAVGRDFVARIHEAWSERRTAELVSLLGAALAPRCTEELAVAVQAHGVASGDLLKASERLEELVS